MAADSDSQARATGAEAPGHGGARAHPPADIRVMLVDDHTVVRVGYRMLLQTCPRIGIVAECASGEAAYREYGPARPDVVIMDLSLPGVSGFETTRRLVARHGNAQVLAFSMHEDLVFVEQALQAGARGYITKNSASDVLVEAVKTIASGGFYLEPEIAQAMAFNRGRGAGSPFEALSTREFEILCLLAAGHRLDDVASRLALSYKTVANYSVQIKNKLGVQTTAELTRLAIRHGLVEA